MTDAIADYVETAEMLMVVYRAQIVKLEANNALLRTALSAIAGPDGGYDTWEARLAIAALEGEL
jgi:hypothetical protein